MKEAWEALVAAIETQVPDVRRRAIEPPPAVHLKILNKRIDDLLPKALLQLYAITDGLTVSGYLPDAFDRDNVTFSLLPVEEIPGTYQHQMSECRVFGGVWCFLPHTARVAAFGGTGQGIWNATWIPFAWDGAGDLQFVDAMWPHRVYQYSHETDEIRRCGPNLARYFTDVARDIRDGTLRLTA